MTKEKILSTLLENKDKRINVKRGCPNQQCFCTGKCNEIVGYWENGVYTSLNNNNLNQKNITNELFYNKR